MDYPLLVVTGLAMFLTTFDMTAVVMAMPQIRRSLSLDIGGFAWVMDAYSLAFTVCLMGAGLLADRHGRRRAFVAGTLAFLAASMACAFAPSAAWLFAGRALQGVAAAFVVCAGLAIVAQRHPQPRERARAFGVLGVINGLAMALGPAGGGLLTQAFGWQSVFLANLPLCAVVLAGTWLRIAESRDTQGRRIDWPGLAALSAWLVAAVGWLMHGLEFGTVSIPAWAAAGVLMLLAAAFLRTQRRAAHPVFDLALFRRPAFVALCTVHVALSVGYWSVLVYLPVLLLDGLGRPAGEAPLLMLAATVPMVALPPFGARLAALMPQRTFFGAGLAVAASGAALIAAAAAWHSLPLALAGMLAGGMMTALLGPQALTGVVGAVPPEKAGAASAVTIVLRQGGFALGIAVLTAVARATPQEQGPSAMVFGAAALGCAIGACAVAALLRPRAQSENSSPAFLGGVTPR